MDKVAAKSVTLRHVAERAGVSSSTASLVLNGKGDIPTATRRRVLKAASELSYRPRSQKAKVDPAAQLRFLKVSKHGETVNRDHSHFISDYIDGMSVEAARRELSLEVMSLDFAALSDLLRDGVPDDPRGVVVLGTELDEADILDIADRIEHVVFIDTYYPHLEVSFVDMDNDQAVYRVASHLGALAVERIGFVGSHSAVANFRLRDRAFRRACRSLGIRIDRSDRFSVPATRDGAYRAALRHFARSGRVADAYFCVNDIIAFGVMAALQELGHEVPRDVSIIGFDNLPTSSLTSPSLSTVNVPKQQIGAMAIRLLDDRIASEHRPAPVKALVAGELIIRDSTT